jgi:hypothetical protein
MHEIAIELYMQDHRDLEVFNTPEETELREGGYLDRARVLAIRKVTEQETGRHKTLRKVKDHGDI